MQDIKVPTYISFTFYCAYSAVVKILLSVIHHQMEKTNLTMAGYHTAVHTITQCNTY